MLDFFEKTRGSIEYLNRLNFVVAEENIILSVIKRQRVATRFIIIRFARNVGNNTVKYPVVYSDFRT